MFLMGLDFLHGLALGTSLAVVIAMLAAITLLPALLGFVGFAIDKFRVGRHKQTDDEGFWHRWSAMVQRRPWPVAIVGFLVLFLMALPMLNLRLGSADASNDPAASTTHQAYDLIARGFGPGANGPVLVVADTKNAQDDALAGLLDALRVVPGVASVTPARPNEAGTAAIATLFATTGPQERTTEQLVHRLRGDVIPNATDGTGLVVHLGGQTAGSVDFSDQIGSRLPIFIGAVLMLSFLLLLLVFRSLLVPLKAVIMNLLSIGAAYGVIVAIFQWGWVKDAIGIGKEGPIEAWVPMMLFAIVFGLSMDYEVFLLSRIKEEYDLHGDNSEAVAHGLAKTARLITAAAAIMICVFGSFVLSDLRVLKLVGFGLAFAVFIDATLVRLVLVPATMELLGDRNWWLPKWLEWLPHVNVEGEPDFVSGAIPEEEERAPALHS
jgi:RND superfamily putative drug exporter